MPYFPNYSAPPRQPFQLPISSHPPAAPCGPGRRLANGAFVSRGGVFEGPAMSRGDSHCGYWSDPIEDASLWQQGYPQHYPAPQYDLRVVKPYPGEIRSRFQPRSIMLGFPPSVYPQQAMGNYPRAGVQPMDPMWLVDNRRRQIWTGPLTAQQDWPDMLTPRGGVLDGNTLQNGASDPYAAFYDSGGNAQVMLPPDQIDVLPNPLDAQLVPSEGWGIPGTPADMRTYQPAKVRQNYGAQEATRSAPIMRGDQSATQPRAVCPKAVTSSPIGRAAGGARLARSMGAGPDGLGCCPGLSATPIEYGRPSLSRRARVRSLMRRR